MSPNIALNQLYSFHIFFFMLIYTLNSHFSRNSSFISNLAPSSRTSRTRSSRASSWGAQKTFTPSIGLASPKTFSQVIWTCSYSLNYLRTSYNQLLDYGALFIEQVLCSSGTTVGRGLEEQSCHGQTSANRTKPEPSVQLKKSRSYQEKLHIL
jgi:hypothetical protein